MKVFADISFFNSLQDNAFHSGVAFFNADVKADVDVPEDTGTVRTDDIKDTTEEWLDLIQTLRELNADAEAEAQEGILEGLMNDMKERMEINIKSLRGTISELKQSGVLDDDGFGESKDKADTSQEETDDSMGDFDLGGGGEGGGFDLGGGGEGLGGGESGGGEASGGSEEEK